MLIEMRRFLVAGGLVMPAQFLVAANMIDFPLTPWTSGMLTGWLAMLAVWFLSPIILTVLAYWKRSLGLLVAMPIACILFPVILGNWYDDCDTGRRICCGPINLEAPASF